MGRVSCRTPRFQALSPPVSVSLLEDLADLHGASPHPVSMSPSLPRYRFTPPGFLWDNPVLILERRRFTNRGVAVSCGIIELITVIIALIINVALFLPTV